MMTQMKKLLCLTVTVLLMTQWIALAAGGPGPSPINSGSGKWWPEWDEREDTSLAADEINITTAQGHTAYLPCQVLHLQDKRVSWIRTRDLTVLALDRATVTTDARFSVKHPEETGDWILEIRGAHLTDSGTYDCQVNTHPKKSTRVNLRVLSQRDSDVFLEIPPSDSIAPTKSAGATLSARYQQYSTEAESALQQSPHDVITLHMRSGRWAEVMAGKALNLSCEASGERLQEAYSSSRSPSGSLIEWTLDQVPVTLLFDKQKVEIYEKWLSNKVISQLTLFDLSVDDSGTFACLAPHAATQVIPVTVLYPGSQRSNDKIFKKYSRKDGGHDKHEQMDAAPIVRQQTLLLDRHSIAASCSSHRTIVISGAVMLAILLLNCAIAVALYWKTH